MERSFYVVVYDVVDDKRRLKVARYMESIGDRVQKSVFEVYLTVGEVDKLMRKVNRLIDNQEDSVRIYLLCDACRGKVRRVGQGKETPPPGLKII